MVVKGFNLAPGLLLKMSSAASLMAMFSVTITMGQFEMFPNV